MESTKKLIWFFLFNFLLAASSSGYFNSAEKLADELLGRYGANYIRPMRNQNDPVEVTIDAPPAAVFEFVELRQQITFQIYFTMIWRDEKLTWEPGEYNGTDMVQLLVPRIWTPDIVVLESPTITNPCPSSALADVSSDGIVRINCLFVATTFCQILVRYFPFDFQHCSLTYMSWMYDHSTLHLDEAGHDHHSENILLNGVWELAGLEVEQIDHNCTGCEHDRSQVRYTVELRRTQSLFYGINILLPSVLMSLMNLLVFRLPVESGEKISFVMTNVLALILFQQLVSSSLPPSGNDHPLIGKHLSLMIVSGCVAILWTICVIKTHYSRTPFPKGLKQFILRPFARYLMRIIRFRSVHLRSEEMHAGMVSETLPNGKRTTRTLSESSEKEGYTSPRIEFSERDMLQWQEFAFFLDWLMFIAITLFNLVLYLVMIITMITQNPDEYHDGMAQ